MDDLFTKFLEQFPPNNNLLNPTDEVLEWYSDKLPEEILNFWKKYRFGNYANALIKIIEHSDYMDSLYTWLGGKDFNNLPILIYFL